MMIESPDADTMDIELDAVISQIITGIAKRKENGKTVNEAMTETFVIDKLLPVLGYVEWEDFEKRDTATNIDIPDYTMLPGQNQQWYLEVKRWQLPLREVEASQTVRYAFNQGKRWAVLTNGDEWRVYDAHSQCQLADKCTIFARHLLEAKSLLKLLAKNSMLNGEIEKIHHREHVLQAVREEISNENSATIKSLRRTVESNLHSGITKQDVMDALKDLLGSNRVIENPGIVVRPLPPIANPPKRTFVPNQALLSEKYSLKDLAEKKPQPIGYKTVSVSIDGSPSIPIKNWKRLATTVIEWFCSKYGLPDMPYTGGLQSSGKRYFLNTTAYHSDGADFIVTGEININGQPIYVEMNQSAFSFCVQLERFISDMGGDPSNIIVEMVKK